MEKYGFMPGTHEEHRDNPPVRSKFDKSQGKGLPAPHLKFPGGVVKESGSKHSGFNENGHMLPTHRTAQNTDRITKGRTNIPMHGGEPETVSGRGSDKHIKQHSTGHASAKMGGGTDRKVGASRPQHQDNKSARSKEGAGVLSGGRLR